MRQVTYFRGAGSLEPEAAVATLAQRPRILWAHRARRYPLGCVESIG